MAPKTQIKKMSKLYHKDMKKAEEAQKKEVCQVYVEWLLMSVTPTLHICICTRR